MTGRPEAHNARDHTADALAFIKATYLGDGNGRAAVARNCDPAGMVDSMAALVCSLIVVGGLDPLAYLDGMLTGVAATADVVSWCQLAPRDRPADDRRPPAGPADPQTQRPHPRASDHQRPAHRPHNHDDADTGEPLDVHASDTPMPPMIRWADEA